jgi:hypothetical protein
MAGKWLENDWSLTQFLYYMAQIAAWTCVLAIILQISVPIIFHLTSGDVISFHQAQVVFSSEGLAEAANFETETAEGRWGDTMEGNLTLMVKKGAQGPAAYLLLLVKVLFNATLAYGFYLLSKILKEVIEGAPFTEENTRRLYIIGWMIILSPIFTIVERWILLFLIDANELQGVEFPNPFLHINYGIVMLGILVIVLGYIFKEGSRIYQEQLLTV